MAITITQSAGEKIREFIASDGRADVFFRVAVEGGGCKGFSYSIGMDTVRLDDDTLIDIGADVPPVAIDGVSGVLLDGSQVDWKSTLAEEKFVISNPNASSSCGCGTSFSM
ncbi:iron-sulfur cluster assembly accessory protein [Agrobacterium rubi]|nr:iron-sulfur cluster assembly accessory protein [Agrobacterium rubi]NTF24156.1 iron-sulfur cluster assembly accessory protein [Agrobacterium rubi]